MSTDTPDQPADPFEPEAPTHVGPEEETVVDRSDDESPADGAEPAPDQPADGSEPPD